MKDIFSKDGLGNIKEVCQNKTVFGFDFDGTLSKVVDDYRGVEISTSTRSLLLELKSLCPIAIISGRSLRDLKNILNFEPNYIIGNHGLEASFTDKCILEKSEALNIDWFQKYEEFIQKNSYNKEVEIENKTYSFSIHFSKMKKNKLIDNHIVKIFEDYAYFLDPRPKIIHGKYVLNIVPYFSIDKGTSLLNIMKMNSYTHSIYIGDDVTDEDVFSLCHENILSIRVNKSLQSKANFYLEKQSHIDRLIAEIIKLLK